MTISTVDFRKCDTYYKRRGDELTEGLKNTVTAGNTGRENVNKFTRINVNLNVFNKNIQKI